ncbi:MAG: HlyD family efflux transporter periplasmic adaptor subunit [Pseudomonadota bacterium]
MKKSTWIWAGAGVAAAIAALAWAFAPRPVEVETAQVTQGRFEATIDEDGKTRLRDRYVVSAPLAGRLDRITLREGDAVRAGDPVAGLMPVLPAMLDERTLREQRAQVEAAEANVRRAAARIEGARVALQQARNELQRSEQLARQGFVSPTKLDNDRLALMGTQKELEAAEQERQVARHQLEQARAAVAAVQASGSAPSRRFVLRAPVSGRVLRVAQTSEATVPLGTPLLELGDTARLEVVAELLTTDALQARPGGRVLIERWGGSGALEGRVRLVEPGAFTKVSALGVEEQRVRVLIDITSPPERWQALGDGYRVSVRIVTTAQDQAVKVPVSAVFPRTDEPGMAVFVLDGGRARLRPVELAARNGNEAWVKGGVQPGTTVVVYPPASVRDGLKLKPRKA